MSEMGIVGMVLIGVGALIVGGLALIRVYSRIRTRKENEERERKAWKPRNPYGCMQVTFMHKKTGREVIFKKDAILGRETLERIPFYAKETIRLREGELWINGGMAYLCTSSPSYQGAKGIKINGDELIIEERIRLFIGTYEVEIREEEFLMHVQKIIEE